MNCIAKIIIMLSIILLAGCEAEWRIGEDAINAHHGVQKAGELEICETPMSPFLEAPTYCEQWPGLECCAWRDNQCTSEWCRWHDSCEWDWQYTDCESSQLYEQD
jgi:hypothetical protein